MILPGGRLPFDIPLRFPYTGETGEIRRFGMKSLLFAVACLFLLLPVACSSKVEMAQGEGFSARTRPQTVFVVPFTTIMVPDEVSTGLFDRFVDDLNRDSAPDGLDYVILKQGLDAIDAKWLASRDYVTGEVFAYVEDMGSSTATIRAKSRISLYQTGQREPTLQLDYPVEIFYEKDYTQLEDARRKLARKIADSMAQKLSMALRGK